MTEHPPRYRCCFCGNATDGAIDYVVLYATAEGIPSEQTFGAHESCANEAMAPGFSVELHQM